MWPDGCAAASCSAGTARRADRGSRGSRCGRCRHSTASMPTGRRREGEHMPETLTMFESFTDASGLELWLPLAAAAAIGFSVAMYVLMDGFDLGVGILFPGAARTEWRDAMMVSVAPVWDGNETWLVMGGGGLLALFPLAYATLLPAYYLPITVMLLALILRGVAFEFRFRSAAHRPFWSAAFHVGSVVATLSQGIVLGAFAEGRATLEIGRAHV